jgi:Ca2+-binding EF-hand superfamily protein
MYFAGDNLYIGQSETLGIWAIPVAEIEAAIAAQKQVMLAKKHQDAEAVRQLRDKMLAQYDRNHNGIIDPDEKEEALDDPAFIESELDVMDANHNGRLDPEEIVYFDANTNKILEAKEQAGFDIAQHLLAVKLLKKFDANGDGLLDRREFDDLLQPIFAVNTLSSSSLSFPDQNRDGQVGLGELELFLNQQTRGGLRVRRSPLAISKQIGADPNKPIDSKQIFKTTVEAYWQNPGSITNRPPFNRMPPGRVVVTNGTQSGKAQ